MALAWSFSKLNKLKRALVLIIIINNNFLQYLLFLQSIFTHNGSEGIYYCIIAKLVALNDITQSYYTIKLT